MAYTYPTTSSSFPTHPAAPPSTQQAVLPVYASEAPYFHLLYHPLRWMWFKNRWLPSLRRLPFKNGSQHIENDDVSHTLTIEGKAGWRLIPHDAVPGEDYVVAVAARGGMAHFSRWDRFKLLGEALTFSSDENGYADYLERVCCNLGLTPDPDVIEAKIAALEHENLQDETAASHDVRAAARARASRKMIDAMRAALQPVEEPAVEATPSPRRKS
jgi:ribosomal protein L12E/L44/L45/RPP1/RPP2